MGWETHLLRDKEPHRGHGRAHLISRRKPDSLELLTGYVGVLAEADDTILLVSTPDSLQAQLLITSAYSRRERLNIRPTKSTVSIYNVKDTEHSFLGEEKPWKIKNKPVKIADSFCHLGIHHSTTRQSGTATATVDERIPTSRKTAYALMGSGLHAVNGISPCSAIYTSYQSSYIQALQTLNRAHK